MPSLEGEGWMDGWTPQRSTWWTLQPWLWDMWAARGQASWACPAAPPAVQPPTETAEAAAPARHESAVSVRPSVRLHLRTFRHQTSTRLRLVLLSLRSETLRFPILQTRSLTIVYVWRRIMAAEIPLYVSAYIWSCFSTRHHISLLFPLLNSHYTAISVPFHTKQPGYRVCLVRGYGCHDSMVEYENIQYDAPTVELSWAWAFMSNSLWFSCRHLTVALTKVTKM